MISETFTQDLRVGVRGLAKRPGFTIAALLTLALGIGANAAVFSVVNGVLLAPLPYRDADCVAVIWSKWIAFEKTWVSDAENPSTTRTWTQSFQDVGGWSVGRANLTGDGDALRVGTGFVTPNLLSVLGSEPMLGRSFTEAEALPDTASSPTNRDPEPWPLAAALCRTPGHHRHRHSSEWHCARSRRRDAARVPVADRLRTGR